MIARAATPYTPVVIDAGGTIAGTITFAGNAPGDSVVRPTQDQAVCGEQVRTGGVAHSGNRLGEAVVWLVDARRGKPVPLERRYAVMTERCALSPRVQGALAGGTVNVASRDRTVHRTRLVRQGPGETLALVTEHDEGQVVPIELEHAGLLRITCDVHPWTHGWIAVFDHPYFDVTGTDGGFTLDGVPPGEYTLAVWHPRWGRVERRVSVGAGGTAKLDVQLGG